MSTYALIHGAWGSGAQWRPLVGELERRGHAVVAPDLPIEDDTATFRDYARVVAETLSGIGDDAVLVAHSMGGLSAPLVAAAAPVASLVFVGALIPQPGRSLAEVLDAEPVIVPGATAAVAKGEDGLRRWPEEAAAREILFHDCEPAVARWAFGTMRGQSVTPYFEPCPLDVLPDVRRRSIVCARDRLLSTDWSREAARRLLGVEAEEIDTGHTPHVARPAALADMLEA